jgi:hypothetical protein
VEYGGLLSVDEEEVIVDDELIRDEDSEALGLTVEESPGYDTGSDSLEIEELEIVELPEYVSGSDWLKLSELDESDGRTPPLVRDKELELDSETVLDTLIVGLIGPIGEPDEAKV